MDLRAGILGVVLLSGCFQPRIQDGQVSCESSQLCPTGFFCVDGSCRTEAPDTTDNTGSDAGRVDDPDAGPTPDGPLADGPKVYRLVENTWTRESAAEFFDGSTLNLAQIGTAWSYCDAPSELRCFADSARVACHDGTGWGAAPLSELDSSLTNFNTTYSSAVGGGNDWELYVHRGEDWRSYLGAPPERAANTLNADLDRGGISGVNADDLDQIYGDDPNAPASFDDVVADYVNTGQNGDPWSFITGSGFTYQIKANSDDTSWQPEPTLALPNAPLIGDLRTALHCSGELMLYALN